MAKSHRKRSIAVQRGKNESLLSNDLRPKNGACPFTFSMKRQCASRKRSISVHYSALSYVIFVCQQRTFSFANKEQIPLLPRTVFLCQQGKFSFANKESFPHVVFEAEENSSVCFPHSAGTECLYNRTNRFNTPYLTQFFKTIVRNMCPIC